MASHGQLPRQPSLTMISPRRVLFTNVTFTVHAQTAFGQSIKIVGDCPSLGSWQIENAVSMHTCEKCYPVWSITVPLPINLVVEYKYIRITANGDASWEETPFNRKLYTEGESVRVEDGSYGAISEIRLQQFQEKKIMERKTRPLMRSSENMTKLQRIGSDLSQKKPLAAAEPSRKTVLIVLYRLPIRAKRNIHSNELEFSWDHDALYFTSSGLRTGLQDKMDIRWVGVLNGVDVAEDEQESVHNELVDRFQCIPVWLNERTRHLHYQGFCKDVLWPIFHHVVDLKGAASQANSDAWKSYCMVNNSFAQKIIENYNEGTKIWIHDYHLLLLPSYLRRKIALHRSSIGIFLHTPFPSSEVYRILPMRIELLQGLLSASIIGFQTFEYARHFLTCCKRLMGLEHDSRRGGFLQIDYNGRQVLVRATHIGIDPQLFKDAVSRGAVIEMSNKLETKYRGSMLVAGFDPLDKLKGIGFKFLAVEALLRDYPRYRGRFVLLQIGLPRSTNQAEDLKKELCEIATRVNRTYGDPATNYLPIVFEEKNVSFEERVALYCASDAVLITSIRDGLNLVPFEYLIASEKKKGVVVVSEFTGCSRSLGGALRINPMSIDDIVVSIDKALSMDASEKSMRHERDRDYVAKRSTTFWALNFLRDLELTSDSSESTAYLGIGLGLGFRVLEFGADFRKLEINKMIKAYQASRCRLIFLDYEGTLTPIAPISQLAAPDESVIRTLTFLCSDPRNIVYIVSGRQKALVHEWFSSVPKLGLAAEHGFFYRKPGALEWEQLVPDADFSWMQPAAAICELYTERTEGSQLEVKDSTLVWRYRDCDPEFGSLQCKELYDHLQTILANFDLQVQRGKDILEVKLKGINKGVSMERITQESLVDEQKFDFILAMGDDRADEDMFSYLKARFTGPSEQTAVFSVTVGRKPSHAHFFVEDVEESKEVLQAIRISAAKTGRVQSSMELRSLGLGNRLSSRLYLA